MRMRTHWGIKYHYKIAVERGELDEFQFGDLIYFLEFTEHEGTKQEATRVYAVREARV